MSPRGRHALFPLTLAVLALVSLFLLRGLWQAPSSAPIAAMPEEEFADNPTLRQQEEPLRLDTELTAAGYLALLAEAREPETLLWEGSIHHWSGASSRSFIAAYRKEGKDFQSELLEAGVLRRGLRRQNGRLTLTADGRSVTVSETEATTPLAAIGLVDLATLLDLPPEQITTLRFEVLDGEQVIYLSYQDPELPLTEHYWISLAYAIPLRVETYQGEELTYLAETTVLNDGTLPAPEEPQR